MSSDKPDNTKFKIVLQGVYPHPSPDPSDRDLTKSSFNYYIQNEDNDLNLNNNSEKSKVLTWISQTSSESEFRKVLQNAVTRDLYNKNTVANKRIDRLINKNKSLEEENMELKIKVLKLSKRVSMKKKKHFSMKEKLEKERNKKLQLIVEIDSLKRIILKNQSIDEMMKTRNESDDRNHTFIKYTNEDLKKIEKFKKKILELQEQNRAMNNPPSPITTFSGSPFHVNKEEVFLIEKLKKDNRKKKNRIEELEKENLTLQELVSSLQYQVDQTRSALSESFQENDKLFQLTREKKDTDVIKEKEAHKKQEIDKDSPINSNTNVESSNEKVQKNPLIRRKHTRRKSIVINSQDDDYRWTTTNEMYIGKQKDNELVVMEGENIMVLGFSNEYVYCMKKNGAVGFIPRRNVDLTEELKQGLLNSTNHFRRKSKEFQYVDVVRLPLSIEIQRKVKRVVKKRKKEQLIELAHLSNAWKKKKKKKHKRDRSLAL